MDAIGDLDKSTFAGVKQKKALSEWVQEIMGEQGLRLKRGKKLLDIDYNF